jgi:hypothetical protein
MVPFKYKSGEFHMRHNVEDQNMEIVYGASYIRSGKFCLRCNEQREADKYFYTHTGLRFA